MQLNQFSGERQSEAGALGYAGIRCINTEEALKDFLHVFRRDANPRIPDSYLYP